MPDYANKVSHRLSFNFLLYIFGIFFNSRSANLVQTKPYKSEYLNLN